MAVVFSSVSMQGREWQRLKPRVGGRTTCKGWQQGYIHNDTWEYFMGLLAYVVQLHNARLTWQMGAKT